MFQRDRRAFRKLPTDVARCIAAEGSLFLRARARSLSFRSARFEARNFAREASCNNEFATDISAAFGEKSRTKAARL